MTYSCTWMGRILSRGGIPEVGDQPVLHRLQIGVVVGVSLYEGLLGGLQALNGPVPEKHPLPGLIATAEQVELVLSPVFFSLPAGIGL